MAIYGPYNTDDDFWKFYYGIDLESFTDTSYTVKVTLYLGCSYSNSNDRYWSGAKWGFPMSFASDLLDMGFYAFSIEYSGSSGGTLPQYDGTINTITEVDSRTIVLDIRDKTPEDIFHPATFDFRVEMIESAGNKVKPHSIPEISNSITFPARKTRNLTLVYDCNGADTISLQGEPIDNPYECVYVYGTYYDSGLYDADNPDGLFCTRERFHLTDHWNTKQDGSGDSINWETYKFYAEELAARLGLDLSTGDKTATVYLEWERDSNFIPYVKTKDGWRACKQFCKTEEGWKELIMIKQF